MLGCLGENITRLWSGWVFDIFWSFFKESRKLLETGAFRIWGVQPKLVSGPQLGKFVKNIDFLGRIITKKKLKKYTQNIEKSLILHSSLGRRNFYLGRGLATPA
jgi:hypothetical protein